MVWVDVLVSKTLIPTLAPTSTTEVGVSILIEKGA
jgi:hypothetical protein